MITGFLKTSEQKQGGTIRNEKVPSYGSAAHFFSMGHKWRQDNFGE